VTATTRVPDRRGVPVNPMAFARSSELASWPQLTAATNSFPKCEETI
jgi:hypothetical protein